MKPLHLRGYLRVAEAMVALAAARLLLRAVPFERLRFVTGRAAQARPDSLPRRSRLPAAAAVRCAVRRGARRLPWHSTCLVRALAARMMLTLRRVPSTLVLGVAPGRGSVRAHAWLVDAGGVVCGGRGAGEFTPLARFGPPAAGGR